MAKKLSLLLVLLFTAFSVFSATWSWSSPYDDVYGYRYQFDSESEDGWTYVGPDVRELTAESISGSILYVQLSLDGINWSPSGMAEYIEEDEEMVEEVEVVVVEEDDGGVSVITPTDAFIRPSIVGRTERMNRNFEFSLDFDLGFDMIYKETLVSSPYGGLVIDFKNIYSPTYWFGLGLRLKGGSAFNPLNGNIGTIIQSGNFAALNISGYTDLDLALSFIIADSVDLTLALGGGLSYGNELVPSLFDLNGFAFGSYASAGASIDRYIGTVFHIGLSYYARYFFGHSWSEGVFVNNIGLHLGVTF